MRILTISFAPKKKLEVHVRTVLNTLSPRKTRGPAIRQTNTWVSMESYNTKHTTTTTLSCSVLNCIKAENLLFIYTVCVVFFVRGC